MSDPMFIETLKFLIWLEEIVLGCFVIAISGLSLTKLVYYMHRKFFGEGKNHG